MCACIELLFASTAVTQIQTKLDSSFDSTTTLPNFVSSPRIPKMQNPKVFLSVSVANKPPKHIIIELYAHTTPITAAKFHSLCTGQNISQLHYKNSTFHRILLRQSDQESQLMGLCQGGTLPNSSKEEIESVYGIGTKAENFINKHDGFGTVSMVSPRGPQFFILTGVSEKNDGKYVVVGRVVDGLDVVCEIANVGSFTGEALASVVIVDCGEVRENSAPNISLNQKMSSKELERVISTSNKMLLNIFKKIVNVNKQLIEVDPEDVDLENENESVKILGWMENNLNVIFHLKAELISLENCQKQLLSQRRTKNSCPLTKKIPQKKKIKLVKTTPQNPACQAQKKCSHCKTTYTPLWRNGPLGPKTLCNACGMKNRSGQLLPQYRPATSPKEMLELRDNTDSPMEEWTPQNPACQAQRKCSHCETTQTPQWRNGPSGLKTLCNACGLKNRSGKLLPQYRPAMSPTFNPSVHSNHLRKIAEMRKKGMFGDVATTPIDAESAFVLTESNAIWSI